MDINRFDALLGYEKTLPPMRKAKAIPILEKQYRYSISDDGINGTTEILKESEFIVYALQKGYKLKMYANKPCNNCQVLRCFDESCTKGKIEYYLWGEKYGVNITKTGYDFALWLISEGLTSFEAVQEKINNETAEKEKADNETDRIEAKQKADAEIQQQTEAKHKKWLIEAAKNYGSLIVDPYVKGITEGEKVLIMRDIFLDIVGNFEEHAKTLLVLIDNIGSPLCRRDLIRWLHNGNTASIKTFEYITGIKLAKTQKERRKQLEIITKADYTTRPKQYKPQKPKEQAEYNDIFYKKQLSGTGETKNVEFIETKGRLWKCNGYDFFIAYTKPVYKITEGKTGLLVASGNTLKEVQKAAREITKNMRGGKPMDMPFAEMIEQAIKNHGISPLYQE